jgi:hypothetical protein
MAKEPAEQQPFQISQKQFFAFVRAMIGGSRGREDDDHPLPPGPWDPIVRVALERMTGFGPQPLRTRESVFGQSREPWRAVLASILAKHPEAVDAIGGGHSFGETVALNPQPLPPRFAFLIAVAQAVISRAELLQEIANATSRQGEQHGIIIVGGFTTRFSDDWCGTGFRLRYPLPGPRPRWFLDELNGLDLMVVATQFEHAAKEAYSGDLRQHFADATTKFVEAALSKIQ